MRVGDKVLRPVIREDVLKAFPSLFGTKSVNGRSVDVEKTIETLTRELRPEIAAALSARRALLQSPEPARKKYGWPALDEKFDGATFREIVQGMIDKTWQLNADVPVPADADPLKNPGLELTGPWHPLDMAFNALNSPAPQNMPDFEDASPPHFRPDGTPSTEPLGVFAALQNAKEIFEGHWNDKAYEVAKKGKTRSYKINKKPQQWPIRFARPPSIHVRFDHITVDDQAVPGIIAVVTLWTLNNYDALKRAGTGTYFYIPKLQTPAEALIVEKLLSRLEEIIGVPAGTLKIKMLYEEGNAGRALTAIAWVLRRRLIGTNVGRWDYLGSLIEMWKDDPNGVFPDPQTIGMASPNMIAYQRWNALVMLLAGGAPIGGMAAVMIYAQSDVYGRSRYNDRALHAMTVDKLRERLLGLITIDGKQYDMYRQSWVASPEPAYVAAGNLPLQAPVEKVQEMLSSLTADERKVFESRGLLTPRVVPKDLKPETLITEELWDSIYAVPKGDITIEHIQHAFYMAANYGFQILNGNFAAAIDDYELKLRFMNDLATYRIDVSWLWTLVKHQAVITKDGYLKRPKLTEDGVEPAENAEPVKAGTRFTKDLFDKVWKYHNEWTAAFFAEQDRRGDAGRFDRSKAPIIMELLRRQLLSPRYIQHSARVLFILAEANERQRGEILKAIFDLDRKQITGPALRRVYDYVYDIA